MAFVAWLRTPSTGRDALFLGLLVTAVYLLTGDHPALGSSTRYTEACREMVELNEWAVPHLGYVPYFEKPILGYWLGAASQWLFGGGHLAANLPSGIAALISVLATYALGVRLRGRVFGLVAAVLLLTSALFLSFSTTLTTDPILAACLAVAWWTWWSWEEQRAKADGREERWIWGFWIALGLAFLAKGPVAVALAGAAIGGYAFLAGGLRGMLATLWAMHPLRGLAVLVAINLPWSLLVWLRDPRLLEFFYIRINFAGFFDGRINHPGPWWYYGPILTGYLAPFTLIAVPALIVGCWRALAPALRGLRRYGLTAEHRPVAERGRLFLAAVVLFPLLFLSCSASKLGSYPLPLMPAVMLLVADVLWDWEGHRQRWWIGLLIAKIFILQLALACVPWVVLALEEAHEHDQPVTITAFGHGFMIGTHDDPSLRNVDWSQLPVAQLAILLLVAGLVWALVVAVRGRLLHSLLAIAGAFTAFLAVTLPRVDEFIIDLDGSRLMRVVAERGTSDEPVILTQDVVHDYELVHALKRRTILVGDARELGMGHLVESTPPEVPFPRDPYKTRGENLPQNPWLWSEERLVEAWNGPRRLWLVGEADMLKRLRKRKLTVHQIDQARKVLLLSNQP